MKTKEFKVKNLEEFQNLIDEKDVSIATAIIDSILSNIKTRKKKIQVFSVRVADEDRIYDITIEKDDFKTTLKKNLKLFEEKEMYEECIKINDAIIKLK